MALSKSTRITMMLVIDVVFFVIELGTGFWIHSLALMADAFHMLNDIISLLIGLWAVSVAQKQTTDEYTYGWQRAEILGAFFNAVFLIALCVSILLEAITRLVEPPEIGNPEVMLIVGSLGLMSNLAGFAILGGHGHDHGAGDDHKHDDHDHSHDHEAGHTHGHGHPSDSPPLDIEHGRRRHGHMPSINDVNFHPSSFRQSIIEQSRSQVEQPDSDSEDSAPTETSQLLPRHHNHRPRSTSDLHHTHNHNKPREAASSHGHSHADMGMNAMVLHVLGDALGNVGVIVTALIIWLTEWKYKDYADPAVSLFITLIILHSAVPLTRATSKVLLQATPEHLDVADIRQDIEALPGVVSCHHVHIWQLSDTNIVASMHMQVAFPFSESTDAQYMELSRRVRHCLHAYGIHSATIQPEFSHPGASSGVAPVDAARSTPCMLECVADCVAQGCCSASAAASLSSSHTERGALNSQAGHEHEHSHEHAHPPGHEHNHSQPH